MRIPRCGSLLNDPVILAALDARQCEPGHSDGLLALLRRGRSRAVDAIARMRGKAQSDGPKPGIGGLFTRIGYVRFPQPISAAVRPWLAASRQACVPAARSGNGNECRRRSCWSCRTTQPPHATAPVHPAAARPGPQQRPPTRPLPTNLRPENRLGSAQRRECQQETACSRYISPPRRGQHRSSFAPFATSAQMTPPGAATTVEPIGKLDVARPPSRARPCASSSQPEAHHGPPPGRHTGRSLPAVSSIAASPHPSPERTFRAIAASSCERRRCAIARNAHRRRHGEVGQGDQVLRREARVIQPTRHIP